MARTPYGALNGFPKKVDDVNSWLDQIQLGGFKRFLVDKSLEELLSLSNADLEQIIPLPGQRRRLILAMHALETNIPIVAKIEERMQSMSTQSGGTGPQVSPKRREETSRYPTSDTSPRYILAKPTWDDNPPSNAFASSSPVSESRTHLDAGASDANDAPSATSDVANNTTLSERSSDRTRRSKDKADSEIKSAFF